MSQKNEESYVGRYRNVHYYFYKDMWYAGEHGAGILQMISRSMVPDEIYQKWKRQSLNGTERTE